MAPDVKKRNETEIPQSFWGKENKACPKCGKEILAAAVRCRYCGARFLSERPLGTSEFEFQEKIKTKKTAIKRTIIILLILNIISVSAPIAAIAASVWYSYNKKMVAALPSLYRTLIIIGITTGVVQSVLIITMASLYSFFPG
jgi:DNA-directed RNA polymerase subunit RPC12/RpoP